MYQVELQMAVYTPHRGGGGDDGAPPPLVVSTYGGPGVQHVANTWEMTADLRVQHLVAHGCCVLKLDNRGSARRGVAFEVMIRAAERTCHIVKDRPSESLRRNRRVRRGGDSRRRRPARDRRPGA